MHEPERTFPPQHQGTQPGRQGEMHPQPRADAADYRGSGKLRGKLAIVTGGDSGIGRSVAISFAKEGADVVIVYLEETEDARHTHDRVVAEGVRCLTLKGDIGTEAFCGEVISSALREFGRIDILVNNAAEQHPQEDFTRVKREQVERTFRTNLFAMFDLVRHALPHLDAGACIINTTSVTAYRGHPQLVDYAATKGAIVAFTRSLSLALVERGIRVNAVAPGPIWTPLIPATFDEEHVARFGSNVPMKRPGQPDEVSPCYVFLASADSSYISGQVLHPNGGEPVNG
ncbi:SDR family oxidoreductase [Niveibacterium sp. SC-1]|uniref:SDR family oxidoreductase n=1 Tax=Niveibacterium sp. SC-1 TaxID=3135646 RepID=UPI00311FB506